VSGLIRFGPIRVHDGAVTDLSGGPSRATTDPSTQPAAPAERVYVGYLAAQAVLGLLWWLALTMSPTVRRWFELFPGENEVMDAFVFADVLVVVVGSGFGAWGLAAGKRWTTAVLWFTAGGIVYPTLYLFGWLAFTSEGGLLLGAMVVVSTFTCWIAYHVWRARQPARRSF
jgi:hypothetical protein